MKELTVFYNKECGFCNNVKRLIEKLDTENFIIFKELEDADDELTAMDADGNKYYSEEVMVEISKLLPGIKRFSWMFKGKMGKRTSELFYGALEKVKEAHNKVIGKPCKNC